MSYITQMDAARKGILTPQMENVLKHEPVTKETLFEKIASGKIAIPANKNHKNLLGVGIGEGLKTKVNVNLGVSEDSFDQELELEKARLSIEYKADAIMDLSTYGDTRGFRKRLIELSPLMIGTVPMYDAVAKLGKKVEKLSVDSLFEVVESHCKDGVDFLTIHAGLTRVAAEVYEKNPRLTHIVSRGGSILYRWMRANDKENPFYEHYDRLLEICQKHDVTLSLGDGLRPGSLKDATDAPQIQELIFLGELTKRAWEQSVQVMIEGPGHVPINEIEANVLLEKKLCHGAPFYVLGPLVSDIAPGYDHITAAIGGAVAASAGADFLCYVTPAEHLRLPDLNDVKEGLIASRIAAHAGDIAKGLEGAIEKDHKMSGFRGRLDWMGMFNSCIDPVKAREYRSSSMPIDGNVCTMCGDLCPIKNLTQN